MSGIDIAVKAYIDEHGTITADAYDALSRVFLEYRDPKGKDELDASLSALEQRDELKKLKPQFLESLNKFYNVTLVEETEKDLQKRCKNPTKVKSAMVKCRKKYKEWSGLFINVINASIDNLPGLPQPYGEKLVSLMRDTKTYDASTHKEMMSMCKKCLSMGDKIKTTARQVFSAVTDVVTKVAFATTTAAIIAACIAAAGVLVDIQPEQIVGQKSEQMTDEEYEQELDAVNMSKNLGALAIGGLPIATAGAVVGHVSNEAKKDKQRRKANGTLKKARA